jgi:FAD:protein FMN transferase
VGLWSCGPREEPPSLDALSPSPLRDWRQIELDHSGQRAKQPDGVQLDLSSIAKGFAAGHIAAQIEKLGASSYLVDGGELRGRGVKRHAQPWWVAIEPPLGCLLEARVALTGRRIATCGVYWRRFEHNGRVYAHPLDLRTRRPLKQPPASVSVIHRSWMAADAWSTALMILGLDQGLDLCREQELSAVFVLQVDAGWRAVVSPAFAAMLD